MISGDITIRRNKNAYQYFQSLTICLKERYHMGFQTISVKEAVNNINANLNGWFLPAVQRPYVWGSRY